MVSVSKTISFIESALSRSDDAAARLKAICDWFAETERDGGYRAYRHDVLEKIGLDVRSRLLISESCPLILPYHVALDQAREGRLFILGVGGSAGHAGHAVNDFRKIEVTTRAEAAAYVARRRVHGRGR